MSKDAQMYPFAKICSAFETYKTQLEHTNHGGSTTLEMFLLYS